MIGGLNHNRTALWTPRAVGGGRHNIGCEINSARPARVNSWQHWREMWAFSSDSSLTEEFVEEVEDVLPRRASLLSRHLPEVGGAVVQVHPVDALGQQGQHALRSEGKSQQGRSLSQPAKECVELSLDRGAYTQSWKLKFQNNRTYFAHQHFQMHDTHESEKKVHIQIHFINIFLQ